MNKLCWNFNQIKVVFFQENLFENVVCKMAAILFRFPCVNKMGYVG